MVLIEKLKLTFSALMLAAVALASTTGILLAYQTPSPRKPGEKLARQRSKPLESAPPTVAALPADDDDVRSEKLVDLQVAAELLELRVNAQKGAIENDLKTVMSFEPRNQVQALGLTPEQIERQEQAIKINHAALERGLNDREERYRQDKIKLAQLKRQIARESKALGESAESAPDVAELSRRLDHLEAKVDRLLKALPDKSEP